MNVMYYSKSYTVVCKKCTIKVICSCMFQTEMAIKIIIKINNKINKCFKNTFKTFINFKM